jgi:hypothetical protein
MIKSSIDRSSYISIIHSKTGIRADAIIEDFNVYEKNHLVNKTDSISKEKIVEKEIASRRENLEKRLFGIIFWQEGENSGFDVKSIHNSLIDRIGAPLFKEIMEANEPWREILASEAQMWYGNRIKDLPRDIEEIMMNLEEEILNERLILLKNKINGEGSEDKDFDSSPTLIDYQKTVERIEKIKSNRLK